MSLEAEEIRSYIFSIKEPSVQYLLIIAGNAQEKGMPLRAIANVAQKPVGDVEAELARLEERGYVTSTWRAESTGRMDMDQLKWYQLSQKLLNKAYEAKNVPVGH